MGVPIYLLCALAAAVCSLLLARAYAQVRGRLLFFSAVCFALLTLNNVLVAIDLVVFPEVDLFVLRNVVALVAVLAMIYGLVGEAR